MAADEFRRLVRDTMLSEVVLGEVIGKSDQVTQTERKSLIDWCHTFAKKGPWRSIRSKRCWCKSRLDDGRIVLMVAIRHELFAQMRADKRLSEMGPKAFARRAARYNVGTASRDERPHGESAVTLDDIKVSVAELLQAPPYSVRR